MAMCAMGLALLEVLPVNFDYPFFAAILFLIGFSTGTFVAPNRAGVMNSLPPQHRGAGSGMNQTFQNSAQVLSIGIFFTLMILGLAAKLPHALAGGLEAQGVPPATAVQVSHLPPVSVIFAAFLGYDPLTSLVGKHVMAHLTTTQVATLSDRRFFPSLISAPFRTGLHEGLTVGVCACLLASAASWSRGRRYVHNDIVLSDRSPHEAQLQGRGTSH